MQFVHVASVVSPPLLFFFFRSAGKKSAIVGAEMEIFTSDRARSRGFVRGRGDGREGGDENFDDRFLRSHMEIAIMKREGLELEMVNGGTWRLSRLFLIIP